MIEVKPIFADWHEADIEEAKRYVEWLMSHMPAISGTKQKFSFINSNLLRGITAEELIGESK